MGGVSTCIWQCIFGCIDAEDVLTHYLECPVLWQFAREALRLQEDSIFLLSRLCIVEPSICKLQLLAFTHCLYHALKNDPRGVKANGFPVSPNSMQILASEISRSIRYTIPGVTAWAVLTLSWSRDSFLKENLPHPNAHGRYFALLTLDCACVASALAKP